MSGIFFFKKGQFDEIIAIIKKKSNITDEPMQMAPNQTKSLMFLNDFSEHREENLFREV